MRVSPCRHLVKGSRLQLRMLSAQTLSMPHSENISTESKHYPDKIVSIVDGISKLTLLEVSDLNELLKARLKITDAPVMMAGNFAGGPAAAPVVEEEEEAAPAVAVQVVKPMIVTRGKVVIPSESLETALNATYSLTL